MPSGAECPDGEAARCQVGVSCVQNLREREKKLYGVGGVATYCTMQTWQRRDALAKEGTRDDGALTADRYL